MSSYEDSLRKRLDETFAPGWKPTKGDEILGVVERVSTSTEGEYGSYPIVTVRRIIGGKVTPERVAIHAFHTSLKRSMERDYPERGMIVAVRYEGHAHNDRTNRDFEAYKYTLDSRPPRELVEEAERMEMISESEAAAPEEPW